MSTAPTKQRPVSKSKLRAVKQQTKLALDKLSLTQVLQLGFITKPPEGNVKLTKLVLTDLWNAGLEAARKAGKELRNIVVEFEPSYKTMHRWENRYNGVVPFSKYPEFEIVVEYVDTDGQEIEPVPTAVYESTVHRFSTHHLWNKGVPKTLDVLDFLIIKTKTPSGLVWVPAFSNQLVFDKGAIAAYD